MRARLTLLFSLLFALLSLQALPSVALAQDETESQEQEGTESEADDAEAGTDTGSESESGTSEGEDGAGEEEAETGAGEGETEGAVEEEGPPWTYQMARITLVLLILLFLAMGLLYWRLLASRQRAA